MNKFLICGDLHITDKRPENRIDNYEQSIFNKLNFIFQTAKKYQCQILQPGDFFDMPNPSYRLFTNVVRLLNKYNEVQIYSVYGQHCLRFRTKENTASKALIQSCANFNIIEDSIKINKAIFLYGSSYNEPVPEITTQGFNILITHRMMIQDKLWEGQTEYTQAGSFLRANKFQLVVSGDNHQGFIVDSKLLKKQLVNCGSLLRSKTDQLEHQPFIVIYDTNTREYEKILVPIEPAEKVFNLEKVIKEKEKDENLASFVTGLSESKEIGLKFEDNLNVYLNENSVETGIREIIKWSKTGEKE